MAQMFDQSLFERLENPEQAMRTSLKVDASRLADSVMDNLKQLFNCRQGAVTQRPDYGMPDFNDLALQFPDAIPVIGRAIKYQIDQFEPRLTNISVKHVPVTDDPLALSFTISGELKLGDDSERIRFETILGDDGHVKVRA